MINVTTPLGFTRAFTCKVTPVSCEEIAWVCVLVPPPGVMTVPVSTGTCAPTLIEAGMLSVVNRQG